LAKQTGNKVTFTWGGTGSDDIYEARGHAWMLGVRMAMHDTTSEQATWTEFTPGVPSAQMRIRLFIDSADGTPTMPTGTAFTATVKPYGVTDANDSWAGSAYVEQMEFVGTTQNGAPPSTMAYTIRFTGTVTRASS
jgi:hypothetical protein